MTIKEYAKTLPEADFILAYISCVESGLIEDLEIAHLYAKQAHERMLTDYPLNSSEDVMRFFDEINDGWEKDDPDLVEERKEWEKDPWGKLRQALDNTGKKWCRYGGYYFIDDAL